MPQEHTCAHPSVKGKGTEIIHVYQICAVQCFSDMTVSNRRLIHYRTKYFSISVF